MRKIKTAVIGMGGRGMGLMKDCILTHPSAEVVAVCDVYHDRTLAAGEAVKEKSGKEPFMSDNYKDILAREDVELVVIATSWETHCGIACDAMRAGKTVAMEVCGSTSLEECFELVRVCEETGARFTMLENCMFGRRELMALNMVKQGIFGEIVHCDGGYCHDLRGEVSKGVVNRHYRFRHYKNRNCENYPTHELGPIARVLDVNYGNRMVSLTSTASRSSGLHEYIKNKHSDDEMLMNTTFKQGDVVTTVIKCARGETITLTLETTLPRCYSRKFTVHGTKGCYAEDTDSVYIEGETKNFDEWNGKSIWGNAKEYEEKYEHPVWKKFIEEGVKGTHGGMDTLEFDHLFNAILNDKPFEVDVYDAASWICITALSEKSIALGSAPVEIPDFTHGEWMTRTREDLDVWF